MSHYISKMVWVGNPPWHGLGAELHRNARYEEIVELAGFYRAEEKHLYIDAMREPIPDRKALIRSDNGRYLSTVGRNYNVVQFEEIAKTLVEAADGVGCIFHTGSDLREARRFDRGSRDRFWT